MNPRTLADRSIPNLLNWATGVFEKYDIDSPRMTAEILLAHALHLRRLDLYARNDQPLDEENWTTFKSFVERRLHREPVAYITRAWEFWSLPLSITSDTLIPRPETECLVEKALSLMNRKSQSRPWRILDLGTGSGAIILAIASERPDNLYIASDYSADALAVAKQNARRLNMGDSVLFYQGEWLAPLKKDSARLDLIVANPPYIATDIIETLQPEVSRYEPFLALDGGSDGLSAIRNILQTAPDYLNPGGHLLIEIGYDQKESTAWIALEIPGMTPPEFFRDAGGHDRVLHLQKKD